MFEIKLLERTKKAPINKQFGVSAVIKHKTEAVFCKGGVLGMNSAPTDRRADTIGFDFIPLEIDTSPEHMQQVTREFLERTLVADEGGSLRFDTRTVFAS